MSFHNFGGVRAPSRAARRRKRGYRQNIRFVQVPKPDVFMVGNIMVGHPETIAKVLAGASLPCAVSL